MTRKTRRSGLSTAEDTTSYCVVAGRRIKAREPRFNISEVRERERKRKTEGSETSERDKLESGTGERKLPRA